MKRLVPVWFLFVLFGLLFLLKYEFKSGDNKAVVTWPDESNLKESDSILIMFLHPRCPCSRASLENLQRVLLSHPTDAYLVFPEYTDSGSRNFKIAKSIPGVKLIINDKEIEVFQISTSGHILFYHRGKLLFSGGITSSRGHSGENRGLLLLSQSIHTGEGVFYFPVFGCDL